MIKSVTDAVFRGHEHTLICKKHFPLRLYEEGRCQEILKRQDCVLSVQVLQEFYVQATRAGKSHSMSHQDAVALIGARRRFEVQPHTFELLQLAFQICERFRFSYWDSAIVAAAIMTNCDTLYTEDLQHGQIVSGIKVVNPFAG